MNKKPLYSITRAQSILKKYRLTADKQFGQNFLIDANALHKIVSSAEIDNSDFVLEIGPGLGVLSYELAQKANFLRMIELDKRLLPIIEENLEEFNNFEIINQDALNYDFENIPDDSLLVANLPYNVATPIIIKALESGRFKRLVFLVQKEVALRMAGNTKGKDFGILSLLVEHFGTAKRISDISPNSFFPAPKVTSSIVRIDTKANVKAEPELFDLIHSAFRHRRKTLKKNLIMAGLNAERALEAIDNIGLKTTVRAEELSLADFKQLKTLLIEAG